MIRVYFRPTIALAGAALLLASCGKSAAPQAGPTASGEILPGSVTDAMLDTDRSQAVAPLASVAHSAAAKPGMDASSAATAETTNSDGTAADAGADQTSIPQKPVASGKPVAP
jgi:hypothetical protein